MPRQPQPPPIDGAIVIQKPSGRTSHDVVEVARRLLGFRQIGHLGTLDPLATGVLVLLLGRATRLARFYTGRRKSYSCTMRFGFATDTYDADGKAQGPDQAPQLTLEEIQPMVAELTGHLLQTPPAYSAKKIAGRPAHELARKNRPVELKPVEVDVFEFRIESVEGSRVRCVIECGSGTYIRSLAHDLGARQGTGAHLEEISRVAVGEFTVDQAVSLEELESAARQGKALEMVIPLERLLPELPRATVLPVVERRVRHGARFTLPLAQIQPAQFTMPPGATSHLDSGAPPPPRLRVFSQQQKLIAVAEAVVPRTYQPLVVFEVAP
ncbi:MAG TPA: tRNA pseudouridine(55) synthase TruB [Candidatus Acidoferrales bacterium]|nr:tRNA pseudouridine(55) synthase TruB [Candidatus Acidoferrales bacterium]